MRPPVPPATEATRGRGLAAAVRDRAHLIRFAAFAVAAMAINLLIQNAVLMGLGGVWFAVYASLVCGTVSGLIFKYVVDKNWVFEDRSKGLAENSRKFAIYTATGILTTVVFWGVELTFHYIFGTHLMTVVGGATGLTVGYILKYNLDKHFTFRTAKQP